MDTWTKTEPTITLQNIAGWRVTLVVGSFLFWDTKSNNRPTLMLISRKCVNENVGMYLGVQVLISLYIYMIFVITWSHNQYPIWCRPLILINTCHRCRQINDPHICCSRFKIMSCVRLYCIYQEVFWGNYTKKTTLVSEQWKGI